MTSADPTVPHPMSTQRWNPYTYVGNSPLRFIDPTGEDGVLPCVCVSPDLTPCSCGVAGEQGLGYGTSGIPGIGAGALTPSGGGYGSIPSLSDQLAASLAASNAQAQQTITNINAQSASVQAMIAAGNAAASQPYIQSASGIIALPGSSVALAAPMAPGADSLGGANSGSASAYIHNTLLAATFLPSLLGSAASFADSLVYFAEGDRINGGIALGAAALGIGTDAGLVRLGLKGAQVGVDALRASSLAANRAVGLAGEARAGIDLVAEGNTILGSQVSVRTSKGLRVIDHLIQTPSGQIVACEVKCGGAFRNTRQLAKDKALATTGGIVVGRNAPDALRGQQIVMPTIERRY